MKTERQLTGKRGEDAACEHLRGLGQTVLARNWRHSHLEIDIITADPAGVHFVEVKTRTAPIMAPPELNVGPDKQRRLVRAAQAFVRGARLPAGYGDELFFDVVSVVLDGPSVTLEYFPQAWVPIYY